MATLAVLVAVVASAWGPGFVARFAGESEESLGVAGERIFLELGCDTCHSGQPGARGPSFAGLYGSEVNLGEGGTRVADEAYLRESIWKPGAAAVAGYDLIMPVYQGQVDEAKMVKLVAYIRTLAQEPR